MMPDPRKYWIVYHDKDSNRHHVVIHSGKVVVTFQGGEDAVIDRSQIRQAFRQAGFGGNGSVIASLLRFLTKGAKIKKGLSCDASFKEGQANLAVVKVENSTWVCDITIHVKRIECGDSIAAEDAAIKLARELYPDSKSVKTDCGAAKKMNKGYAVWVPRESNAMADAVCSFSQNKKRAKR